MLLTRAVRSFCGVKLENLLNSLQYLITIFWECRLVHTTKLTSSIRAHLIFCNRIQLIRYVAVLELKSRQNGKYGMMGKLFLDWLEVGTKLSKKFTAQGAITSATPTNLSEIFFRFLPVVATFQKLIKFSQISCLFKFYSYFKFTNIYHREFYNVYINLTFSPILIMW